MDSIRTQVTDAIAGYLDATGLSARAFGIQAVGSEHFVARLKNGTSIRLGTIERALRWMADHPPDQTADDLTSA
jgi:hypothetical protein